MSLAEYNDPGTERSVSDQGEAPNSAQDDLRSGKEAGRTLGQDCGRVAGNASPNSGVSISGMRSECEVHPYDPLCRMADPFKSSNFSFKPPIKMAGLPRVRSLGGPPFKPLRSSA